LFALLVAACAPAGTNDAPRQRPSEPWTFEAVRPDTSDGVRILVLHDMEGLSGQSDPATFDFGTKVYAHGQELLAGDVNAVVGGLMAGGATEVHVVDGHGSGNPEPDVRRDLLDLRATQILRDAPFDTYFDLVAPNAYDAVAVVGMHAKTGSRGFASHTLTLGIGLEINGRDITETELVALSWGRQGIPVIFASGDDRLAADLAGLPWVEFVTVKTATAADSADPRPVAEARADLTAKAQQAVENLRAGRTNALRVSLPMTAGVKAVPPASLALLDGIPGIAYADSVVTFAADSMRHAYDVMEKLVGIATTGYATTLRQTLRADSAGARILDGFGSALTRAWFDYESGRWQRPSSAPAPTPSQKYHGYR
jgi:D-amino peptidase